MENMSCHRCKELLPGDGDFATCRLYCKMNYHIECTGLSVNTYRRMSESKRNQWKCIDCRQGPTRTTAVVTDTPGVAGKKEKEGGATVGDEDSNQDCIEEDGKEGSSEKKEENMMGKIVSVKECILVEFNTNMKNMVEEMKDLKQTVQFLSDKYDKLLDELKNFKEVKENYEKIIVKTVSLENRVNELEQYSRGKNLEIKGVEENVNENLKQVIINIATKMGDLEIDERDIDIVHRVGSINNRSPKDIVVQFRDRSTRNKLLAKKKVKIISTEITKGRSDSQVYINEHLTQFNKQLFWETKMKSKVTNYKYIWVKDGKIFGRKDDNERVIRIRNEEDLKKMV